MNKTLLLLPVISLLLLPLAGCNKEAEEVEEDYHDGSIRLEGAALQEAIDYRDATAAEYYAANPDFFKSGTDLPEGLDWQDGSEQAEFTSPEAKRGGVETILVPDYPRTFRFVGDDSSTSFRSYIHDDHSVSLVKKHPETGGYYTGLAEKWAISEDKKTVFFKLDPNAKFSDNVPVRTNHFKYTFYFMRSKWINAPWYNNWYSEKYTHLTVYDDLTFSVGLKDAKPDSLRFFEEDLFPKPEHFYKDFGEDYLTKYGWRFEPTTGPYIINRDGIKKGRSITQSRLDDWWANDKRFWRFRYNPDQRKYVVTKDPDKALESFIAGNYDMYRIRTPDVWGEKLDKPNVNKGYIVRTQYYNQVPRPCYSLRINKSKPHLDNRDVREGLQYATNFESVLENYFRGLYQRMESSSDGYGEFSSPVVQARRFSPEIAREYFAKAGFDQTGPDGILMNAEGQRLSFTITTGYRRYEDVLAILKQEALKAGVEYRLEIQEATAAWKKVQEKKHEITLAALNRSVEMYPRYFDFYHSYNAYKEDGSLKPNTNNFTVTSYPKWDEIIDRYEASTDANEIKNIAWKMEELIHEDAAFIPGWVRPYLQCAYWRWVQWPDNFAGRLVKEHDELNVHWIDEEIKTETLAAMKDGKAFEAKTLIFDKYKK